MSPEPSARLRRAHDVFASICPACGDQVLTREQHPATRRSRAWVVHIQRLHQGLGDRDRSLLADEMRRREAVVYFVPA